MKERLDKILVEKELVPTRSQAQDFIRSQKVLVNGKVETKTGFLVSSDDSIELTEDHTYVGRGAYKIAHALEVFEVNPKNKIIADIGASTGGFTDYLLSKGALKSYCIDVGHGQLAPKLLQDSRVINLEGINIKRVTTLPEPIDFCVVDLSFISITQCVKSIMKLSDKAIVLVKPQFEVGADMVGKNGVIKSIKIHMDVLQALVLDTQDKGYFVNGISNSPIEGKSGNKEFFFLIEKEEKEINHVQKIQELFI